MSLSLQIQWNTSLRHICTWYIYELNCIIDNILNNFTYNPNKMAAALVYQEYQQRINYVKGVMKMLEDDIAKKVGNQLQSSVDVNTLVQGLTSAEDTVRAIKSAYIKLGEIIKAAEDKDKLDKTDPYVRLFGPENKSLLLDQWRSDPDPIVQAWLVKENIERKKSVDKFYELIDEIHILANQLAYDIKPFFVGGYATGEEYSNYANMTSQELGTKENLYKFALIMTDRFASNQRPEYPDIIQRKIEAIEGKIRTSLLTLRNTSVEATQREIELLQSLG